MAHSFKFLGRKTETDQRRRYGRRRLEALKSNVGRVLDLSRGGMQVVSRKPIEGTIETTFRCNLSCVHCYVNEPAGAQPLRAPGMRACAGSVPAHCTPNSKQRKLVAGPKRSVSFGL